jgi:hypothetical protein
MNAFTNVNLFVHKWVQIVPKPILYVIFYTSGLSEAHHKVILYLSLSIKYAYQICFSNIYEAIKCFSANWSQSVNIQFTHAA